MVLNIYNYCNTHFRVDDQCNSYNSINCKCSTCKRDIKCEGNYIYFQWVNLNEITINVKVCSLDCWREEKKVVLLDNKEEEIIKEIYEI